MTPIEHRPEQTTGSPPPGEPDLLIPPIFLVVGKLRRPHGIHGEIIMDVLTDFPERLQAGARVYVGADHRLLRIQGCRTTADALLVSFEEYSDRESVGVLRNELLYVRKDEIPTLPEGEYYHHQILGLHVVDEDGVELGTVVDILETGANDVCVVRPERGPEILLPVIESTILQIDLDSGVMRVHLLEGLV